MYKGQAVGNKIKHQILSIFSSSKYINDVDNVKDTYKTSYKALYKQAEIAKSQKRGQPEIYEDILTNVEYCVIEI